jgi:hypothetical protein
LRVSAAQVTAPSVRARATAVLAFAGATFSRAAIWAIV